MPPSPAPFFAFQRERKHRVFGGAFGTRLPAAAWHDKPSYAIVATGDRELDPATAQRMAKRAGSKVTVLEGGHLVFVARPRAVAHVIETTARAVR
ncbi:alpha/beta hydrolase [Rhodanobacter glycinis]|uniref:Alpha/beta hydrolase n=1 Tax=Rhodanobacter glycinis TaxID=582702 RepID=A0A502C678_9GAMM|nr:alpha/beta hydrolase [Rhodanobacter glycinis]